MRALVRACVCVCVCMCVCWARIWMERGSYLGKGTANAKEKEFGACGGLREG